MFIDIQPSMKGSSGGTKPSQGVDQPFLRSAGAKDMVDVVSKTLGRSAARSGPSRRKAHPCVPRH